MENKELIISVINKYESAQEISNNIPNGPRANLRRGNKHSISYFLEDIMGAFIADLLPNNQFEVWVEQTFTFNNEKSQFKPDITIVKLGERENTIVGFVEVKDSPNPFRWNSIKDQNRGIEYVEKRIEKLQLIRGNMLAYLNQITNQRENILVANTAKFDLVLFSNQMFKSDKLSALKILCNGECLHLHILLVGYHPNVKNLNYTAEELIDIIKSDDKNSIYSEVSLRNRIEEIVLQNFAD